MSKLYYTAPADSVFYDLKEAALSIWSRYDGWRVSLYFKLWGFFVTKYVK